MKRRSWTTAHEQVSFQNTLGQMVEVDEGLYDILMALKGHGVNTQFSCQGNGKKERAYILSDFRSAMPLLKKIRKQHKARGYSQKPRLLLKEFDRGNRVFEFSHFKKKDNRRTKRMSFNWGNKDYGQYPCLELSYSLAFGLRFVIRWPHDLSQHLLMILEETK